MINSLQQLDFNKKYTYPDYLLWKFKERVELLRGRLFPMAVPNEEHQFISGNLYGNLWSFLSGQACNVYSAPFNVRLPLPGHRSSPEKTDTVVQPDICVVCDLSKIDKQGYVGPPDLMVEILSPGNSEREMKDKFELYQEAGVKEYWIFSPAHKTAWTYHLNEKTGQYQATARPFTITDVLKSRIFPALEIKLIDIFPRNEHNEGH